VGFACTSAKFFVFEVLVAYQFLPHPFLINNLEQPFAQEATIFDIQNFNSQTSLVFWATYHIPFESLYFFLFWSHCQKKWER
jgi:hypothetical protein